MTSALGHGSLLPETLVLLPLAWRLQVNIMLLYLAGSAVCSVFGW